MIRRVLPRSLQGQVLLAIALALLVAQAVGAALLYKSMADRRDAAIVTTAAYRLAGGPRERGERNGERRAARPPSEDRSRTRSNRMGVRFADAPPQLPGERRLPDAETAIAQILDQEGVNAREVVVVIRPVSSDQTAQRWIARNRARLGRVPNEMPQKVLVAGFQRDDGRWVVARAIVPPSERRIMISLILQTILIYAVLVGAVYLILRRITGPLAALRTRMERFAQDRDPANALAPSGPSDVRRLIAAHTSLEGTIAALLDEKDVMLGAIGHDLKTPLAALRVRIESVENDDERERMAAGIEDINRSLDDILSLARVGRPSDPLEPTELSALVGALVEEYEDMGQPVTQADGPRLVLQSRETWLRRALRNLIDNAVRYGGSAQVSHAREGEFAVVRIVDSGPGIPPEQMAAMLEPFTRLETSRNTGTGGAGLGLTLARAIADQHGGRLMLANRPEGGLEAALHLPIR